MIGIIIIHCHQHMLLIYVAVGSVSEFHSSSLVVMKHELLSCSYYVYKLPWGKSKALRLQIIHSISDTCFAFHMAVHLEFDQ